MPEFPPSLIFTSTWNSQFPHSCSLQNRWLLSPLPTMAPSFTCQESGFSLAFQLFRVFPSNRLIEPFSCAGRTETEGQPTLRTAAHFTEFMSTIVSRRSFLQACVSLVVAQRTTAIVPRKEQLCRSGHPWQNAEKRPLTGAPPPARARPRRSLPGR